ncbi:hypothetical protein [Micromonospora humida]|uniref:hypothetical protein n=1 Tax=Micromonospora humida TaxID=2809018 RepID=UPI0033CA558D
MKQDLVSVLSARAPVVTGIEFTIPVTTAALSARRWPDLSDFLQSRELCVKEGVG